MVFSIEDSPVCLAGFYESVFAMYHAVPKIEAAFRSGKGLGWNEHHQCLFTGTERFFRTSYNHHLVQEWLPPWTASPRSSRRVRRWRMSAAGMAPPPSSWRGRIPTRSSRATTITSLRSIAPARPPSRPASSDRVRFDVAPAQTFPGSGYDLVTFFDCLHDMGDPAGAAAHVFEALARDGTWMVVEPMSHDTVEANFNPVGQLYYGASTMICTPASMAQDVGARSAPRQARQSSRRSSRPAASRASASPPRRRSTWSSKPDPEAPRHASRRCRPRPGRHRLGIPSSGEAGGRHLSPDFSAVRAGVPRAGVNRTCPGSNDWSPA